MSQIKEIAIKSFNDSASNLLAENGDFKIQEKVGNDSIVYSISTESDFRTGDTKDVTVAKVKEGGKLEYISFADKYIRLFDEYNIQYSRMESGNAIRLNEFEFLAAVANENFTNIIEHIVLSSFNYPTFGCCGKYIQCSNVGHCIHNDVFYATASCQYKKHLDNGEIFYGDNANK